VQEQFVIIKKIMVDGDQVVVRYGIPLNHFGDSNPGSSDPNKSRPRRGRAPKNAKLFPREFIKSDSESAGEPWFDVLAFIWTTQASGWRVHHNATF
jgi:hypothetical protein